MIYKSTYSFIIALLLLVATHTIYAQAPGGVTSNLGLWLKADNGATASQWDDKSGNGNNAVQGTGTNQPTITANSLNFNPAVTFDGTNDFMDFSGTSVIPTGNNEVAIYIVATSNDLSTRMRILDQGNDAGTNQIAIEQRASASIGMDHGSSGVKLIANINPTNGILMGSFHYDNTVNEGYGYGFGGYNAVESGFIKTTSATPTLLGADTQGIHTPWNGDIHEVIIYSVNHETAPLNRQQIQSYLALKYGITLEDTDHDATITEGDYIASDGTTIYWDYSTNSAYHNDIFGIGRDDNSGLGQLLSKSINTDAVITILAEGESTNDSNTTANYNFTDLADLEFLTIGNNNGAATWTTLGAPSETYQILSRQWSVQETGETGTVQLDFDVANGGFDVPALILGTQYYIIIDSNNDGDYSDETPTALVDQGSNIWRGTGLDLNTGNEFTLATVSAAPGGVAGNLGFWTQANDSGTDNSVWTDLSINGNDLTQGTVLNQPIYNDDNASLMNFNRSKEFNGNQWYEFPDGPNVAIGMSARTLIAAVMTRTGEDGGPVYNIGERNGSGVFGGTLNNVAYLRIHPGDEALETGWGGAPTLSSGGAVDAPNGIPSLVHYERGEGGAGIHHFYNGLNSVSSINYNNDTWNTRRYIGKHDNRDPATSTWGIFEGVMGEVIHYDRYLTTDERQRVVSYLALKYGITIDQTIVTNYLASDNTTIMWNAVANATYTNDVAGIGRDDLSTLNQKQSKSVNADAIVTIGLGSIETTNQANANTFTADLNFLVWGNDNASTGVVNTGLPTGFGEKISRNWFVQETGAVGNTLVQIPNSAITGFSGTDILLLVADDAGFTTNVITVPLVQNVANWEVLYDFNGAKYFTFAIIASSDFMRHGKTFQNGTEQPMKF